MTSGVARGVGLRKKTALNFKNFIKFGRVYLDFGSKLPKLDEK